MNDIHVYNYNVLLNSCRYDTRKDAVILQLVVGYFVSVGWLFSFIKEQFHMHSYQRLISVLLRMRTIDATINCPNPVTQINTSTTPQRWWQQAQHQSNIDLKSFYLELSKCDYNPVILS